MKSLLYNILTVFVLTMAIVQAPLVYYYTSGLLALFVVIPYLIVGVGLTAWVLIVVRKNTNSEGAKFQKVGLILTVVVGSLTLFFGEDTVEYLDWELRRNTRDEIVQLVKEGKLQPNVTHNNFICTLPAWNLPPISNGGNEIAIYKTKGNKFTIEFYINRGFLDHYSAFVYTDDADQIEELNKRATLKKGMHINRKLDKNWYRVSY